MVVIYEGSRVLKKNRQHHQKVKAEAKAEMKNVRSLLDLDLSLSRAAILLSHGWRSRPLW